MEEIIAWIQERKLLCALVFAGVISVVFAGVYVVEVTAEESFTCPVVENTQEEVTSSEIVVVDLKGAVANPGVYRVKSGAIIQEVIALAGGLRSDADTSNLNLSKQVTNEMVITVFTIDEIKNMNASKEPIVEEESTSDDFDINGSLVSLNTASLEDLMTLPGVGEAKAKLILEYREKCGKFKSKEELKNIKGIGDAMYAKMEAYITL